MILKAYDSEYGQQRIGRQLKDLRIISEESSSSERSSGHVENSMSLAHKYKLLLTFAVTKHTSIAAAVQRALLILRDIGHAKRTEIFLHNTDEDQWQHFVCKGEQNRHCC